MEPSVGFGEIFQPCLPFFGAKTLKTGHQGTGQEPGPGMEEPCPASQHIPEAAGAVCSFLMEERMPREPKPTSLVPPEQTRARGDSSSSCLKEHKPLSMAANSSWQEEYYII